MRRIAIAVMTTISGIVLLFSYHTSRGPETVTVATGQDDGGAADDGSPAADDGQAPPTGDVSSSPPPHGASPSPASGSSTPTPAGVSGTFTGNRVDTQWGPVRVRIVVRNGKITKATAIEFPNDNHHDQEINSWAVPQLQEATVRANSARIDSLSGATVTSGGYISSLQSALDKAHL